MNQQAEVKAELQRICDRTNDELVVHKEATVWEVLQAVKRQGDQAVLYYTEEFDNQTLHAEDLRVTASELDGAYQQISPELLSAIRLASNQIESFHRQRIPKSWVHFGDDDVVLGKRYTPVDKAGLYIPGSRSTYPSTVLMNAIPAKVAGVPQVVMVTPPGIGKAIHPAVLVAAQEAGIKEIYRVGGAQAIAALAYGTQTIPKVNLIVGPGNIYVTLAKKLVYGLVGVDCLSGPGEVIIMADETADPLHVATDLLAQAEKDPMAAAILLTKDVKLAKDVQSSVSRQLVNHPKSSLTEKAIAHYGLIAIVESLAIAVRFVNEFAPQHLQLQTERPWELLPLIRHAGAISIGHSTPGVVGEYVAGPSQTLPTSGNCRYASPLGVETFLKHSSIIQYSNPALTKVVDTIDALAYSEGFSSHSDSVKRRLSTDE
ncbi:Histidinol dehydrogenase [Richelia intracellularis]|nr:Histidinol dehydrogenase [Richelia intracellularis]